MPLNTTRGEVRARREDLRAEVLAVLQASGDRGINHQDLVSQVLARHLRLGGDATERVQEADVTSVVETVAELLRALPQAPGPWAAAVGPVFRTDQVRTMLGAKGPVSRQALADRVARRTLLALRTSDRHTVYPAWQFRSGRVAHGVSTVLQAFVHDDEPVVDDWTLASWLRTPLETLGGDSVSERLSVGDVDQAVTVARAAAARWSR